MSPTLEALLAGCGLTLRELDVVLDRAGLLLLRPGEVATLRIAREELDYISPEPDDAASLERAKHFLSLILDGPPNPKAKE